MHVVVQIVSVLVSHMENSTLVIDASALLALKEILMSKMDAQVCVPVVQWILFYGMRQTYGDLTGNSEKSDMLSMEFYGMLFADIKECLLFS